MDAKMPSFHESPPVKRMEPSERNRRRWCWDKQCWRVSLLAGMPRKRRRVSRGKPLSFIIVLKRGAKRVVVSITKNPRGRKRWMSRDSRLVMK